MIDPGRTPPGPFIAQAAYRVEVSTTYPIQNLNVPALLNPVNLTDVAGNLLTDVAANQLTDVGS